MVVSRDTLYEAVAQEALLVQLREIHPTLSLQAYPVKSSGAVTARAGASDVRNKLKISVAERKVLHHRPYERETDNICLHNTLRKIDEIALLCIYKTVAE